RLSWTIPSILGLFRTVVRAAGRLRAAEGTARNCGTTSALDRQGSTRRPPPGTGGGCTVESGEDGRQRCLERLDDERFTRSRRRVLRPRRIVDRRNGGAADPGSAAPPPRTRRARRRRAGHLPRGARPGPPDRDGRPPRPAVATADGPGLRTQPSAGLRNSTSTPHVAPS